MRPTFPLVATIVWGSLLFPGLLGAALSPMFFDAPGSMNNPAAYANALIVGSFPVLCVFSIAATWIVWKLRKQRPARSLAAAQIVTAALPLIPVLYVAGALIFETLAVLTSGQPAGLHSTVIRR